MKLVFLYGPPSVGKLTVAKVLAKKTGYKLLHNHLLQNPISEVFPYDNPANFLLVREFRLRILKEAAKSKIDLIATFGIAGNAEFAHIEDVCYTMELLGGRVELVQLTASNETLVKRVEDQSRRDHGKGLSREKLEELLEKNPDMQDKYPKREHLVIDTEKNSPEQAANEIIEYYAL